jgi:hypothetical protein
MSTGSAPSSTSSTTETVLPDWAQAQVQSNLATANNLAAQPYQAPNLPTQAPFNPDQEQAFQQVRDLQGSTAPVYSTAINSLENLPATTQSLLNPYIAKVGGDVTSNMERSAAMAQEQLGGEAAGVGAFGGTRSGVESGIIDSETQRNIGQAMDTIASQGWNSAMSGALTRATDLGSLATGGETASLLGTGALSQVGGEEQELTQAQYEDALNQWQQEQNYPYQQLAIQQSALAGSPYGSTVTSSQPYNVNSLASGIGVAAAGLPIANTLGTWAGLWGNPTSSSSSTASSLSPAVASLLNQQAPGASLVY